MTDHAETESIPTLTAGQMLREARLKAGLHMAVLSVQLKVSVQQIEALEADVIDPAKGAVFVRGLAASVCRKLNMDPAPVLARLPRPTGQLEPVKRIDQPTPSDHARLNRIGTGQPLAVSKAFWLGALLLALTLSFVWMPAPQQWAWLDGLKMSFNPSSSAAQVSQMTQGISLLSGTLSSAAQTSSPPQASPSAAPSASPLATTVQSAGVVNNPAAGNGAAVTNTAPWIFSATGESWLELRDAQNKVVWSGVLKAGDSTRIDSPLPVRVVVGRASAVSVTLRGQAFDLKPHTPVTVARFEVKE